MQNSTVVFNKISKKYKNILKNYSPYILSVIYNKHILGKYIKRGIKKMKKEIKRDANGYRKFGIRDSVAYAAGDLGCNMSFALKGTMSIFWTQFMGTLATV